MTERDASSEQSVSCMGSEGGVEGGGGRLGGRGGGGGAGVAGRWVTGGIQP